MQQHRKDSESNVKAHIDTCNDYKNLLFEMYPNPSLSEKRAFLKSHFTILEKNLTNEFVRKTFEANYINVRCPNLNKQVYDYSLTLMCQCLTKKSDETIIGAVT